MQAKSTPTHLAHGIRRAAEMLDIPERAVWQAIASGDLRSFKQGKRRLVPDEELKAFVRRKVAAAK